MQQNFYETRRKKQSQYFLAGLLQPLLLSMVIMAVSVSAFAQTETKRTVTGTVISVERGDAVPGTSVVVKGTSNGTTTNTDGQFSIEAGSGSTLVFSFIGY